MCGVLLHALDSMSKWFLVSKVASLSVMALTAVTGLVSSTIVETDKPSSPVENSNQSGIVQSIVPPSAPIEIETATLDISESETTPESESEVAKESEPVLEAKSLPEAKSVRPFHLEQTLSAYSSLFANATSLGMLAIGSAEGNYRVYAENETLYVQQMPAYFGHVDPGNLSWGESVTNYGPCSDQGRSKGNIAQAESWCSARSRSQLPVHLQDLSAMGINPNYDLEAVLNTADLYNQASPIHSRRFPEALNIAYRGGLRGVEAFAWARTASFYLNGSEQLDIERGRNVASGLLGICQRERINITQWDCVYRDQLRRVQAITEVVSHYRQAGD